MSTEVATTRPADPLALIATYLARPDADPSKLERLAALVEWHENRNAERAFAQAMNECQRQMPTVVRATSNNRTGKLYAVLETIQATVMPIALRHGFSVSWGQADAPEGITRVVATLSHVGGHSRHYQGDYPIDGKGAKGGEVMNALQGVVSSHTYAQRDMLRLMFNLTIADQDQDGADTDVIDGKQIEAINRLLEGCEKAGHPVHIASFLPWAINCKEGDSLSLDMVPAKRFALVVDWLTNRLLNGPSKPQKAGAK